MSVIHTLETRDRRFDEAALWIAKLDKGLSKDDEKSLQQWLAAEPENHEVFLQMAEMWDKMDTLARLSELFPRATLQQRRPTRVVLAIAASVLVAMLVGLWGMTGTLPDIPLSPGGSEVAAVDGVYETSIGEYSVVTLPDGTELVLNTNSLVRVNYTDQRRLLVLDRGEVHVKVAHDISRPLSLFAGTQEIRAVGTEFNVEINSDQMIELVVTEGKVLVGVHQREVQDESELKSTSLPASTTSVSKGEAMILGSADVEVNEISPEDIAVKLSWQQGNLIFRGESLAEAVDEIGRYTTVEFVILDENLKKLRISGLFKAGDVEGLLTTLKENFNINHTQEDKGKVILSGD
jgi:transmembrane sensor